jgi:hypothetical protein
MATTANKAVSTGRRRNIHGGRGNDSRTYSDGINTGWAGGSAGGGNMAGNTVSAQEVVVTTSGGLGEAETAGVVLNVIPRDGSNNYSGSFIFSGANGAMQGSNYTDRVKALGLKTPQEIIRVADYSPMGGGRIVRTSCGSYLTYRRPRESTVPGMWFNKNAGNPNAWSVDWDKSRPAHRWRRQERDRPHHVAGHAAQQGQSQLVRTGNASSNVGGGSATVTPEASGRSLFQPSHMQQATWSSPVTSRILLELGGTYQARTQPEPRQDGSHNDRMIRNAEQTANPAGYPGPS